MRFWRKNGTTRTVVTKGMTITKAMMARVYSDREGQLVSAAVGEMPTPTTSSRTPVARVAMQGQVPATSNALQEVWRGAACVLELERGMHRHAMATMLGLLASVLPTTGRTGETQEIRDSGGCLYAMSVGEEGTPILPCNSGDTLSLLQDPRVRAIIALLGIDPARIQARACPGVHFQVQEVLTDSDAPSYLISYPSDVDQAHIAPVAHELSHVMQASLYGGIHAARRSLDNDLRRLELGADYVTGLVLSMLRDTEIVRGDDSTQDRHSAGQFQHSQFLFGEYFPHSAEVHGTPAQRTAAFRYGFTNHDKQTDARKAHEHFQDNLFAIVVDN